MKLLKGGKAKGGDDAAEDDTPETQAYANENLASGGNHNNSQSEDPGIFLPPIDLTKKRGSIRDRLDIAACSPLLAVSFVEAVCDAMQLLSGVIMKLPSCGFRYGLATAVNAK